MTQEFYIREASQEEARGPYNLEQMISLAETGQVTVDTLWYDPTIENWVAIGASDEVKAAIFPEKRKLRMKVREPIAPVRESESQAPITVQDMLAGAEGRTAETKDKIDPEIGRARAAQIGMWAIVVCLVLAAAGEILPVADAISVGDVNKILGQPLAFLGVVDLFLATMVGLGMVTFYPFIRFRAALGFGLLGFIFFAQGNVVPLASALAGSFGLYVTTIWIEMLPVVVSAVLGLAGMAGASYYLLSV